MAGLIIRDETEKIILDTTTRVGEILGTIQTNGRKTGSVTNSAIAGSGSRKFFYFTTNQGSIFGGPILTRNTQTGVVSWDYDALLQGDYIETAYPNNTVYYGLY